MDNNSSILTFKKGLGKIGLGKAGLKVEDFRTDGTSNYLANLNFNGQTWAAVLRLPAKGASIDNFLVEKKQALSIIHYLIKTLEGGVDVGFDCILKFEGVSCLVENSSVQDFFRNQVQEKPLLLFDRICDREKEIRGFCYPEALADDVRQYVSDYSGSYYLSRGAPAWETLEEYPELEEPVAHALAALHLVTGKGTPIRYNTALDILFDVESEISKGVEDWFPIEDSKEGLALGKSLKKWQAGDDPNRMELIRRERFMRTSVGRELFQKAFRNSIAKYSLPIYPLKSFCHGDCHGGNFILVRYQYIIDKQDVLLDRVFLNEIFEKEKELDEVSVTIDEENASIVFDLSSETHNPSCIAKRKLHHEIHLIDLDSGQGTTEESKIIHLYDAVSYAISMANLTRLFGDPLNPDEILSHYYNGLKQGK